MATDAAHAEARRPGLDPGPRRPGRGPSVGAEGPLGGGVASQPPGPGGAGSPCVASRRAVLGRIALGLGVLACGQALGQPAEGAAYVAVETAARTGSSRARLFSATGAALGAVALDFRAHGMACHGDALVVFPRRPGTRFALLDLPTLEIRAVVDAPEGRHFYGHGAFASDGRTLLVTENDLATLDGGVGVYEVAGAPRRLGTVRLPGPGPHDVHRASGGRFEIALGGLRTHPDYGRTPLNLHEFESGIVSLDLDRGEADRLERWPGTDGVSLRHLATDGHGRTYVGGQRPDGSGEGGVLWLRDGDELRPLDPDGLLGGYVSSVAAHGDAALATSKETGVAVRLEGGRIRDVHRIDGASAAALGPGVEALSGYEVLALGGERIEAAPLHEFDNHGLAVG